MGALTWGADSCVVDTVCDGTAFKESVSGVIVWLEPFTGERGASGGMVVRVVRDYYGGCQRETARDG